jgi:hypothetical protein
MDLKKEPFIPYPEIEDKKFYEKIYKKKEFYDTKPVPHPDPTNQSNQILETLFSLEGDFKLSSQQNFLRNFLSELTPYKGIFIWWGTGLGKTCASISIAERFRNRVEESGKKILLIVGPNIRGEFMKTIFNFDKEEKKKNQKQVVQCTGRTYQLGKETRFMSDKQKEKIIKKMISDIYEIIGSDKLRNKIMRETGWNGKPDNLNSSIRKKIKEIYSNRVIVVDEVHNRVSTEGKDQSIPVILSAIVGSAENLRLILMSATPMVNSPDDIIFPINLLRLNDKRSLIKKRDIFDKDGYFVKGGEKKLEESSKGYFSYVRGGETPRFPYEIIPAEAQIPKPKYTIEGDKISEDKKIKSTRIIVCPASNYQYKTYQMSVEKDKKIKTGGLLQSSLQAGNIVFPSFDNNYGLYGSDAIGNDNSNEHPLLKMKDGKGNEIYKYAPYAEGFFN